MRINLRCKFKKITDSFINFYNNILDDIARELNWEVLFGVPCGILNKQLAYFKDGRKKFKHINILKTAIA